MSTEQKPQPPAPVPSAHHKEHLQTTALGATLIHGWAKFKKGELIGYKWMAVILIAVGLIGGLWYIFAEKAKVQSQLWVELESANSRTALEEFIKNHADTTVGRVAEMDHARVLLGPEGLDKLPTARDEDERKRAVANVETARELMARLIDQFKDDPALKLECLLGMAKSEMAFMAIRRDDNPSEFRGTAEKLAEWLDRVSEAAPGTPWGDDAQKLAAALRSGSTVKNEILAVQESVFTLNNPTQPKGFPGGFGPGGFPPPGGGLNLPGIPSGGVPSLTPPIPPISPTTPAPTPPLPEIKAPVKPPETKPEIKAPVKPPETKPEFKAPVKPPETKPEFKAPVKPPETPTKK